MKKFLKIMLICTLLLSMIFSSTLIVNAEVIPHDGKEVQMGGPNYGYLHGNAVIFTEGDTPDLTKVYLDNNADGIVDEGDEQLYLWDLEDLYGTYAGGYDLSNMTVYCIGADATNWWDMYTEHTGDIKVTMTGGKINQLNGSMICNTTGNFDFTMTGGTITDKVVPMGSSNSWTGNVNVTIGGDAKIGHSVYGGSESGNCTIDGNINVTIKDNAQINVNNNGSAGVFAGAQGFNDTIKGTSTVNILGGEFLNDAKVSADVYPTTFEKDVTINVEGGSVDRVCGIWDDRTTAPNVTVNMNGGNVNSQLIGTRGNVDGNINVNVNGGTIGGVVAAKGPDDLTGTTTINVKGNPVFKTASAFVLLRADEFITVTDTINNIVNVKAPSDADGTLIAKPKDSTVTIDTGKLNVINKQAAQTLVYGTTTDTNRNVYLGIEKAGMTANDADFGKIYVDSTDVVTDKTVTVKNTGNTIINLADIAEDENFTYTFDKTELYPAEEATLTVHVKKLPAIKDGETKETFEKAVKLTVEDSTCEASFKILMQLIASGTQKVEEETIPSVSTNVDDLADKLFTEADKEAIKEGSHVTIKLFVKDADDSTPEATKQLIEAYDTDLKVGKYLDIFVKKYVDGQESDLKSLSEKIKVAIEIPENLKAEGRTFKVIRVHENQAGKQVVDALADIDTNADTYTIETDKFPTYALVYYDSAIDTPDNDKPAETGDGADLLAYSMLALTSLLTAAVVAIMRKKAQIK